MRNLAVQAAKVQLVNYVAHAIGNPEHIETWIQGVSVYRPEHEEIIRTPEFMLSELQTQGVMEGDCDDFATLSSALCYVLHVPVRLVAVRTREDQSYFDHVFTEYWNGARFERCDATVWPEVEIPEVERIEQWL